MDRFDGRISGKRTLMISLVNPHGKLNAQLKTILAHFFSEAGLLLPSERYLDGRYQCAIDLRSNNKISSVQSFSQLDPTRLTYVWAASMAWPTRNARAMFSLHTTDESP